MFFLRADGMSVFKADEITDQMVDDGVLEISKDK